MMPEEFVRANVGSIWETEHPFSTGDAVFVMLGISWEQQWTEAYMLNLFTGEVQSCSFDSHQRRGDNHWAVMWSFPRRGLWPLIKVLP